MKKFGPSLNFFVKFLHLSSAVNRGACRRRQVVIGPTGRTDHKDGGYKLTKNLTLFLALPAVIAFATKVYLEHQHEHDHEKERPPFVKYEYMYRRTKRFPWGDGQRSLFHNPKKNPLPESGYEE